MSSVEIASMIIRMTGKAFSPIHIMRTAREMELKPVRNKMTGRLLFDARQIQAITDQLGVEINAPLPPAA